jgi:magnesium transporter
MPNANVLKALREEYLTRFGDEAARAFELLPVEDIVALVEEESSAAAMIFRLAPDVAASVLANVSTRVIRHAVAAVDPAEAAPVIARLDAEQRARVLRALDRSVRDEIRELLQYPPDSAGSLMDPRVTAFRAGTTVADVLERLRARKSPEFGAVYLVEAEGKLLASIPLGEIATAQPSARLDELAKAEPLATNAFATKEEIVDFLGQHRLASLPVVDTLMQAAEQEASADIQTMVGASKDERALTPIPIAVRQRLPWLQINLATAFFAAFIVGLFQDTIARITALAVLMPVVAGESGNAGMQAVAVTLRGLALREVGLRHWPRLVAKETAIGLVNGLGVALVTSAGVFLWSRSIGLSFVIGASMLISMVIAGVSGTSIPMLLKGLGQDPAQSSSIFLTTVTCGIGLLSFLGLATIFATFVISTGG